MQPGFIPVFAKVGDNVFFIKLKTRVNKKSRKIGTNYGDNQKQTDYAFQHGRKGIC